MTALEPPSQSGPRPAVYKLLAVGLAAGILSGLLGVGGGVIIVPLLALWLAFPQKMSQATSLVAIFFASISGAVSYGLGGDILIVPALLIAVAGISGTFIGAWLLHRMAEHQVQMLFVIILVIAAVRMAWGSQSPDVGGAEVFGIWHYVGFALAGLAMGTLSSLVGVGGGIVLVPTLVFLMGISSHVAQGTSLLVMIPIAFTGAWRNSRHGYVNWRAGIWIGAAGIAGAVGGSLFALELPEVWLQRGFAILLLYSAYRLLRQVRNRPRPEK
ncbi:MAG TPA: sulfite exporter TauE/SafE family protein [Actinomycetales bacterium]|nr:sulfite exporter TauE/SafE family protein [Actinomycetales bacterium]